MEVLEWEACNLVMETIVKYYCSLDIKSSNYFKADAYICAAFPDNLKIILLGQKSQAT